MVELGYKKHLRVDHSSDEFVSNKSHINGMKGLGDLQKLGWLSLEVLTGESFICT